MGLLLLASFVLRVVALVGFSVLFWKRRHASLALLALTMVTISIGSGARLAALVSGDRFWEEFLAAPRLGIWRNLLISVASLLGAMLFFRLFSRNDALVERARDDARRQALLLRELDHRVRNNLAGLLALIDLSGAEEPGSLTAERLRRRIGAISECHSLLARSEGEPAEVQALVTMLARANPDVTAHAFGAELKLPRRLVQPLGMILQELFANARKHGGSGPVRIDWRLEVGEESRVFEMTWLEPCAMSDLEGMPVGAGLGLARGLAEHELGGEMSSCCSREGLRYWIRAPLGEEERGVTGGGCGADAIPARIAV